MAEKRPKIIGSSKGLREVLARAARVARSTVSVLIHGESGTGKELLARHVHDQSGRAAGAFVAVNCAAIPKDLLESELFGHERGAFTGALSTKAGAFERAHGGTLFLDEIGDMALEHQAKVLRAIQEGEVQRVGGSSPKKVDVRIVAATHRDLLARAAEGTFREDLYYRLAGYELRLPPLRERGRDVLCIAKALLGRESPRKFFSRSAQGLLLGYSWPGNVRELENVVRAAAIDVRGRRVSDDAVGRHLRGAAKTKQCDDRDAAITSILVGHGRLTPAELRATLGVGKTTAHKIFKRLVADGVVAREGKGRGSYYRVVAAGGVVAADMPARLQLATQLAKERGRITRKDYEAASGISPRTAKRDLAELVSRGLLLMEGAGKAAFYVCKMT